MSNFERSEKQGSRPKRGSYFQTFQPKVSELKREWHLLDAKGEVLGRLATKVAVLLIGKHKKDYVSHQDVGDNVVVINAREIRVTGRKEKQKVYRRHSGYPGGLKSITLEQLREKDPTKIIKLAVYNMLPGNRLRRGRMIRLKVFAGSENPFESKVVRKSDSQSPGPTNTSP
ncbi:MAG: 50S ribosomal protein L13 [bacterium]|nr:50S ribosomal protein L13 [bacterium]